MPDQHLTLDERLASGITKIGSADVVVGIPSFRNAATIGGVSGLSQGDALAQAGREGAAGHLARRLAIVADFVAVPRKAALLENKTDQPLPHARFLLLL